MNVDGIEIEVPRSIADRAQVPKDDMGELIEYELELCERLGVRVPTKQELGYLEGQKSIVVSRASQPYCTEM